MLHKHFFILSFFIITIFSYGQDTLYPDHCLANYNVDDSKALTLLKDNIYNNKYNDAPEESLSLAISTLEDAKLNNDVNAQIYSYGLLALIKHRDNKKIEAFNYITEGYRIVEEGGLKDKKDGINVISYYALFLKETFRFDEALKLYLEVSELLKLSCPYPNVEKFHNYTSIAAIYVIKKDYENAFLAYMNAYEETKGIKNKLWLSSALNNLGLLFYHKREKGDLNKAMHYYTKAKEELTYELKEHMDFGANIDENIGHIKALNKDYKGAYLCYDKASTTFKANGNFIEASRTDIEKYYYLILLGDYKKLEKLDNSLRVFFESEINQKNDRTIYQTYLKLKLKYLKTVNKLEDYTVISKEYQDYLKQKTEDQKILNRNVFNSYVNLIQSSYRKKLKLNKRIALFEQKELRQKYYYLFVVLFLFLIVTLVLFKVRSSKMKQVEQENTITKLVLENTTLEKRVLNQKLEAKNKDIVSIITDKRIRSNFLKLLLERIEFFVKKNNDKRDSSLLSIVNDLKSQIALENRLSVLESDITNVNSNFDAILMEKHPSLSKTEREVCAFIKLNLSIKETAMIRGVSQDSIKMVRSRIRKKLELNPKDELDKFIQSI
jgi:DNA-binding CsgD family transcriptional regulator